MGSSCELDPSLWSTLPHDLVERVFARLPTQGIGRVRTLSKSWKLATSSNTTFTRLCAEVQPNLFGIMWLTGYTTDTMFADIYDTQTCEWLKDMRVEGFPKDYYITTACDGGLVCLAPGRFILDIRPPPLLPIFVCNPLTKECRELPLQRLVHTDQVVQVQLKVDRSTGAYKIILVGYGLYSENDAVVQEYNSSTREWRRLEFGLILDIDADGAARVCDCSTGAVRLYYPPVLQHDRLVRNYVSHMNDLYVLDQVNFTEELKFDREYCVNGCDSPNEQFALFAVCKYEDGNWRFGADGSSQVARLPVAYNCIGIPITDGITKLFVSTTFWLVVCMFYAENDRDFVILYDIEKDDWHFFSQRRGKFRQYWSVRSQMFTCEMRWDACP